jgi:hypothetical protein
VRERLAKASVRLAATWLLGVSAIKLALGSPASLPAFLRDVGLGPDQNFRVSISIELAIGLSAWIAPRLAFPALAGLFAVFLAVLAVLLASGATSCGCFGGAIEFPPLLMLAIDGSLLAFLLATRPRRAIPASKTPWIALAGIALLAAAVPQLAIPRQDGEAPPRYVVLDPTAWIGKPIHETELARWLDTRALPGDATWILFRASCDHCRDFLRRRTHEFDDDPKVYVLVELAENDPRLPPVVDLLPPGERATLPATIEWNIEPPWELVLENERVVSASKPPAE